VGEILVRGPTLMDGYLDDPQATEAAFLDGWLRTGDLGYIAEGELYITGRAKDVIIVRGQNYYAEDIERVAERVPGVRKGCCAAVAVNTGTTEEIGLIVETKLESAEDQEKCRRELARTVWEETGIAPERILLVPPGTVPKTTSGKLQRSRARRLLEGT
jgi:fatty-acyl-CoA synthase